MAESEATNDEPSAPTLMGRVAPHMQEAYENYPEAICAAVALVTGAVATVLTQDESWAMKAFHGGITGVLAGIAGYFPALMKRRMMGRDRS